MLSIALVIPHVGHDKPNIIFDGHLYILKIDSNSIIINSMHIKSRFFFLFMNNGYKKTHLICDFL